MGRATQIDTGCICTWTERFPDPSQRVDSLPSPCSISGVRRTKSAEPQLILPYLQLSDGVKYEYLGILPA